MMEEKEANSSPFPRMATAPSKVSLLQAPSQVFLTSSLILSMSGGHKVAKQVPLCLFYKIGIWCFRSVWYPHIHRIGTLVEVEAGEFHSNTLSITISLKYKYEIINRTSWIINFLNMSSILWQNNVFDESKVFHYSNEYKWIVFNGIWKYFKNIFASEKLFSQLWYTVASWITTTQPIFCSYEKE